ncbi:hypothetical protein CN063_29115 [Sinorhizobium meliloti]|uniref:hypothetical protein n=1 Tax=Rhizobium meliloti TaxID=382 RepID=UPI000FD84D4C|nr:hypothetical protein [Sinorhizobium meliloti]RVO80119.1 hypothetical protein CN088_28695 [Sinorhizobium meliloti]RVQ08782.1 hypothetical protein CN063_29115 [Sinorhizobium meliloti]
MITDLVAQVYGRKQDEHAFGRWFQKTAEEGAQLKPDGRLTLSDEHEGARVLAALLNAIYVREMRAEGIARTDTDNRNSL